MNESTLVTVWFISIVLREWRVAVGRLCVGGPRVRWETARAAHGAFYLVGRGESRFGAHAEPLERKERACHLQIYETYIFIIALLNKHSPW